MKSLEFDHVNSANDLHPESFDAINFANCGRSCGWHCLAAALCGLNISLCSWLELWIQSGLCGCGLPHLLKMRSLTMSCTKQPQETLKYTIIHYESCEYLAEFLFITIHTETSQVTCLNGHPLGVERLETRIGLIVPFFGNGVLDESDTDSDESEDQPEKYTISAFGEISLSEAYITEQVGPAGPATRKPRLQLSRPQMPRGRTRSGKSSPEVSHLLWQRLFLFSDGPWILVYARGFSKVTSMCDGQPPNLTYIRFP